MKKVIFILFPASLIILSCKKENDPPPTTPQPSVVNKPPVANAGKDTIITLPTDVIRLTGSGFDPDGSITSYIWVPISGPGYISNRWDPGVIAVFREAGTYLFQLTVTDNGGLSAKDTVQVIVNDYTNPPGLSGREFEFNNLTFMLVLDAEGDYMYLVTPERPDVFLNRYVKIEVSLRFEPAGNWIPLPYTYSIEQHFLYIYVWPLNPELNGKKASIKVKFL